MTIPGRKPSCDNQVMRRKSVLPPPSRVGIDWQRFSRWSLAGTLVMLLWLLAPTAKCTWMTSVGKPVASLEEDSIESSDADRQRVAAGHSFFNGILVSAEQCYGETPLFGQERFKTNLLKFFSFALITTWLLARFTQRRP